MGADGNRIKLRVVKYLVIVIDRFSAAIFFDRSVRSLGDNIAEILYLRLRSVYKELHADHETGAADNK